MTKQIELNAYSGVTNLKVMEDAHNYNAFLASLIIRNAKSTDRILDFGAGLGMFTQAVSQMGYQVECVEPDNYLSSHLSSKGFTVAKRIEDVPDRSIDYVYSLNVLEHIENDQDAAAHLLRILRPGGRALIYVPAFQLLYSSMDHAVGHFRRYRRKQLIRMLSQVGFAVETARYADSLGFLASLVYRLIGADDGHINQRSIQLFDSLIFPLSRILDCFLDRIIGKNVYVVLRRPTNASGDTRADEK